MLKLILCLALCCDFFPPVVGLQFYVSCVLKLPIFLCVCVGSCLWRRRWCRVGLLSFLKYWMAFFFFKKMCLFRNWSSLPRVMWRREDPCLKKSAKQNESGVVCLCRCGYVGNILPFFFYCVSVLFSCALVSLTSSSQAVLKFKNHDFYHGNLLTEPATFIYFCVIEATFCFCWWVYI